jgi:hypothetical protein
MTQAEFEPTIPVFEQAKMVTTATPDAKSLRFTRDYFNKSHKCSALHHFGIIIYVARMPFLAREFAHMHCRYYCNNCSDEVISRGTISIASFVRTGEPIHKLRGGHTERHADTA